MIILDTSQSIFSIIHQLAAEEKKEDFTLDENLFRHLFLNTIRFYKTRYQKKYGELVLAADSKHSWRRDVFPNYKASRRKSRGDSELDWEKIFEVVDKVKKEIVENLNLRYIDVYGAEADDVIGVLAKTFYKREEILIVSSDKDFRQLQRYPNVYQYSPLSREDIVEKDPVRFLVEHIIRGDSGDGIPNALSDDDVFMVAGKRQTSIMTKKVEGWVKLSESILEKELPHFQRNKKLIDLTNTPKEIEDKILEEYSKKIQGNIRKTYNYLEVNRLSSLLEVVEDFS